MATLVLRILEDVPPVIRDLGIGKDVVPARTVVALDLDIADRLVSALGAGAVLDVGSLSDVFFVGNLVGSHLGQTTSGSGVGKSMTTGTCRLDRIFKRGLN